MNGHCDLFLIEQNQFITISEFFHWFKLKRSPKYLLAFSKIILLILPSSDLHGFNNQQGVLILKFVLWSFSVVNAGYLAAHSISSSNLMPFTICFASKLIASSKRGLKFLYVLVMLAFNNFLYYVGESSYMHVVLSTGINILVKLLLLQYLLSSNFGTSQRHTKTWDLVWKMLST